MRASYTLLKRMTEYLHYLKRLPEETKNVSATTIAAALGLGEVQVRKDLAQISGSGRPKTGYNAEQLRKQIETLLGNETPIPAVLVGAGKLGQALMEYGGFASCGIELVAAFDTDPKKYGLLENGKRVLSADLLEDYCRTNAICIAVLTVPADDAQDLCDRLCEAGIRAIWNFAPVHLQAKEGILVCQENMAVSLALLSDHLTGRITERITEGRNHL